MTRYLLVMLSLGLLACPASDDDDSSVANDDDLANDDDTAADDDDSPVDGKRTFMVTSTGAMGGPSGADVVCSGANTNPDPSMTWKAMLGGLTRVPCADADCAGGTAAQLDWVFAPDTEYLRPDGGLLFTTNQNGIFTGYPMADTLLDTATNFWTGLDSDWTVYPDFHCNDWNSGGVGVQGRVGWSDGTGASWIQSGDVGCDSLMTFLCVEQ